MSIPSIRESPAALPAMAPAPRAATTGAAGAAVHAPAQPGPSAFARLLRGLGSEVQRGEALVKEAAGGPGASTLDAGQLIALQAGVYRYSEAVDLAARLIDHATTGLKTVLQGQ